MPEHELWLTALFNDYLAGIANAILGVFNIHAENQARPWENWIVMELLVVASEPSGLIMNSLKELEP